MTPRWGAWESISATTSSIAPEGDQQAPLSPVGKTVNYVGGRGGGRLKKVVETSMISWRFGGEGVLQERKEVLGFG